MRKKSCGREAGKKEAVEVTSGGREAGKKLPGKLKLLSKLFFTMLYISCFTFGGGFVIITLMKRKFVDVLHWLDEGEVLDMTALAQSSPGAIAVNAAVLIGWRLAGFAGMLAAVLGTILPPLILLSVVSLFYASFASNRYVALVLKGMQAGVAAVILDVAVGLGLNVFKSKSAVHLLLMAAAFVATFFFSVNVIYIILAAGLVGLVLALWKQRKERGKR